MRIVVTGGAGYIGSNTVRALAARGDDVVVFDNLSTGHREFVRGVDMIVGDIRDGAAVARALRKCRAQAVVHFAAKTLVAESIRQPREYFDVNVFGGASLLRAMVKCRVKRIVFSSSAAVYGVPKTRLIDESHPVAPINPYGLTKAVFERMLHIFKRLHGVGSISLRYFNAAGAAADGSIGERHSPETHVIPLVLAAAADGRRRFTIFGTDYLTPDGTCVRDFVHVEDLAQAHLRAVEAVKPGDWRVYNLGCESGYSVRDVVKTAERITGRRVRAVEGPRRPGDPPRLVASAKKIGKDLGWRPRYVSLESIMRSAWGWKCSESDRH